MRSSAAYDTACQLAEMRRADKEKKRKEKCTLFSDHNGSLQRRQPGAADKDMIDPNKLADVVCGHISTFPPPSPAMHRTGLITLADSALRATYERMSRMLLTEESMFVSNVICFQDINFRRASCAGHEEVHISRVSVLRGYVG